MELWLVLLLVALGIPALGVAGFVLAITQRQAIAALQVEVIASGGDATLGGASFDRALFEGMVEWMLAQPLAS